MLTILRKMWAIFTVGERWRLAGLLVMVILMGLAQMASVGSIAPFVSVLVEPNSVQTNDQLRRAFEIVGFETVRSFLLLLAGVVFASVIVANTFLALTQLLLVRFTWSLQFRLSKRLLGSYLAQPYTAFLDRNSADTGKNVLTEVELFTSGITLPLIRAVAFFVAGLSVLGVLLWANPALTLAVVTFLGGGYALIYVLIRRRIASAGRRRIEANTERFKAVNEAFGGIKETKVLGREDMLLQRYDGPAKRFASAFATQGVLTQIPRYGMQVLAIGVILVFTIGLMGAEGSAISSAAPLLALFAFASQRLMTFLLPIYKAASQLRFNSVVADALYSDMVAQGVTRTSVPHGPAAPSNARWLFKHEIRLEGVTFQYPGASVAAIRDVTLTIPRGAFVALVGPTGAGKTTLADIILGLLPAQQGRLTVDGTTIDAANVRAWQQTLGYVPQDIYMVDDTIAANIAFGIPRAERDLAAIERAAHVANIHDFIAGELPLGYDTVVGERGVRLSGGERQRIGIARALYHDPKVLVLDEATSNLDQGTEAAIHKAVQRAAAAKTVIMIAHRLSTTRDCDVLYLLGHGRLVDSGNYEELMLRSDRFQAMAAASTANH